MELLDELEQSGVNVKEGLERLLNNEAIYVKLLKKLPESITAQEVLGCIDSGDIKSAENNAHTIKGVTGNLSITPLYTAYTEIVNLLRKGSVEEARKLYVEILPVQEKILQIIQKY